MADGDKPQKINIGFNGGQTLAIRARPAEITKLRSALGDGGWIDVEAEEAVVALDLSQVVYLLADVEAHRVGFGT
jgi:hypothetical protein